MAGVDTAKARVIGSIGAIQALIENFNSLFAIDSYKAGNTSFTFMLNILQVLGVSESELINWIAKILAGKGSDGVLTTIEYAVKGILLDNIKNILTCSMNPMLPDKLMYKYKNVLGQEVGGEGIEIDLGSVDLYGTLNNCPTSQDGSVFYFDAKESIYSTEGTYVSGYTTNQLWKSCDFNAFLWYVINKGSNVGAESRKLYWDNRVQFIERFKQDKTAKDNFFGETAINGTVSKITTGDGSKINKKQIIVCEYVERSESKTAPNVLRIWLNDNRYYHTRKISIGGTNVGGKVVTPYATFALNKTVFEFNYDYIFSLKLFETKTLVANIINAILGLSTSITSTYSIYEEIVAGQIGAIVKKIIESDDTEIEDCYFTFDNDEYNDLIEQSVKKHNGTYAYGTDNVQLDYSSILESINNIDDSATLQEQINNISNVFTQISATAATAGSIDSKDKFAFGYDMIFKILEETVTQIVMQILSPKVAILFQINQYIMGDIDPESAIWDTEWKKFLKNFKNVLIQTIKQVKEIILQQLLTWVMEKLTPLLAIFASKLLLETINDYIALLKNLTSLCGLRGGSGIGTNNITDIDNVNYADIVPTQIAPNNDKCS